MATKEMTWLKPYILQGYSFIQIEQAITIRFKAKVLSWTILALMAGCFIGYLIRYVQIDPYIREIERDRALLSRSRVEIQREILGKVQAEIAIKRQTEKGRK